MMPRAAGTKGFRSLAALGLLAIAGCSAPNPLRLGSPQQQHAFFTSATEATTQFRALATPTLLTRINAASWPEFDRLVFTFSGKNLPGYWFLSKSSAPGGGGLFEMRFGARPEKANGKPAFDRSWQHKALNYPVLKSLEQGKAGEELVLWQATLAKQSDYRVIELSNPPRIIVDFKR